jgi:hypothetical protein
VVSIFEIEELANMLLHENKLWEKTPILVQIEHPTPNLLRIFAYLQAFSLFKTHNIQNEK